MQSNSPARFLVLPVVVGTMAFARYIKDIPPLALLFVAAVLLMTMAIVGVITWRNAMTPHA